MKIHTDEKPFSCQTVVLDSNISIICSDTYPQFTGGRNPTAVPCVIRRFCRRTTTIFMWGCTQGRSLTAVRSVIKASAQNIALKDMTWPHGGNECIKLYVATRKRKRFRRILLQIVPNVDFTLKPNILWNWLWAVGESPKCFCSWLLVKQSVI